MAGDGSGPRTDSTDGSELVESVDDAFSVLGDETRLQILLELAGVARECGVGAGLAFSELRSRVGVEDSGRFNYHLSKLEDGFIEKSDGEYAAQFPALAVVSAVYAGTYSEFDRSEAHTTESGRDCQLCGRPTRIHYEGNALWLECDEHGKMDVYPAVPSGAYRDRSLEELAKVVYTRVLMSVFLARRGICLQCWGPTSVEYPIERQPVDDRLDEFIWAEIQCERCWNQLTPPLRTIVATHPLVLGSHAEHGYDMLEAVRNVTRIGEEGACESELHETDPVSATVSIAFDDGTISLNVDETCTVVDHEWQKK